MYIYIYFFLIFKKDIILVELLTGIVCFPFSISFVYSLSLTFVSNIVRCFPFLILRFQHTLTQFFVSKICRFHFPTITVTGRLRSSLRSRLRSGLRSCHHRAESPTKSPSPCEVTSSPSRVVYVLFVC